MLDRSIGEGKRDPQYRAPAPAAAAAAAPATAPTVPHPICPVRSKYRAPTFTSLSSNRFSDRSRPRPPPRQTPLGLYTTRPLHTRWRRSTGRNPVLYKEASSHLAITSMFGRVALRHTSWERGGGDKKARYIEGKGRFAIRPNLSSLNRRYATIWFQLL